MGLYFHENDGLSGPRSSHSEERSSREWCLSVPSLEKVHLYLHSWKLGQSRDQAQHQYSGEILGNLAHILWKELWQYVANGKDTGRIKCGNNKSSTIITDLNFLSTILCFPLIRQENLLLLWRKKSKIYNYFHVLGYVYFEIMIQARWHLNLFFVVWCF